MRLTMIKFFPLSIIILLAGCAGSPIAAKNIQKDQFKTAISATQKFQQDPQLNNYFEQAYAYMILPYVIRAGSGFGGAWGSGWVFLNNDHPPFPHGKATTLQVSAGPHIGMQLYRKIIFFKDAQALLKFERGTLEFVGQANLTAIVYGVSLTPAYNQGVAVFTQVHGGLLVEASVGAHRYDIRKILTTP